MIRIATGVALAALAVAPSALAAPGDLDLTFGSQGTSPPLGVGYAWGTDLNEPIPAPGGKALVFGSLNNNAVVIRLTADGDFDPTFDVDGISVIDSSGDETAHSAAVLPDGRIAVVGIQFLGPDSYAVVWMLKPNGGTNSVNSGLDPSFDVDGAAGLRVSGQTMANAVSVLPDRSLLVAGRTGGDGAVWHVKANGGTQNILNDALEPGFGSGGVARLDFGGTDVAWDLATRPDGRILAAGQTTAGAGGGDAYVSRLTPGGQPDLTFDVDGHAGFDNGGQDVARDLQLLPDGRILLAGSSTAANARAVIWRVKPNGGVSNTPNNALDTTFGAQGQITALDTPDDDRARSVVRQSDGKLLVGINSATAAITNERTTIRRITADGAPDLSYGTLGRVELLSWMYGMALLPDQRLLVSRDSATVTRLLPDTPVLAVTRSGNGTGTVTSAPNGISCGATCSAPFAFGTMVAVAAQPDAGSVFAGWSGGCSGTAACQLPMTVSRAVTARFDLLARFGSRTRVTLAAAGRVRAGALRVRIINRNPFRVTGWLRGRAKGRLGPKRLVLGPEATVRKALKLSKKARRALKRKGRLTVRLTATLADPEGTVRRVSRSFRVKKRR